MCVNIDTTKDNNQKNHSTIINNGFYISLDFEFYWGRDSGYDYTQADMQKYARVHEAVIGMLRLFEKYHISATWATVGLTCIDSPEELEAYKPELVVDSSYPYADNYRRFSKIWNAGDHGKWVNSGDLINQILQTPNQELASHTFAHIFCNELGVDNEIIRQDVQASKKLFWDKYKVDIQSLVFPYNQIPKMDGLDLDIAYTRTDNPNEIYRNHQIASYRKPIKRAKRMIDRYIDLTGTNFVSVEERANYYSIPESRFLPPSISKPFGGQIVKRVKSDMKLAAENGKSYHLWWHPHNFTHDIVGCLGRLEEILIYYITLRDQYGMLSLQMKEASGDSRN